jgi:uncharacterized membrane protein YkoI
MKSITSIPRRFIVAGIAAIAVVVVATSWITAQALSNGPAANGPIAAPVAIGGTPSPGQQGAAHADVTEDQAVNIAFNHAGHSADQATLMRVHRTTEDGVPVWDVEFYVGNVEYDYEIAVAGGAIRSFDQDVEGLTIPSPSAAAPTPAPSTQPPADRLQELSLDQAKQIALARVPGATSIRIHLDVDHNRHTYKGEILHDQMEYEFEIDAGSGELLGWESELVDHD